MEQTPKPPVMNEQLKQAIEEAYSRFCKQTKRSGGVLITSSIREFAEFLLSDPEIMRQAGWVREEGLTKGFTVSDMKRAMEFAAIKGWNLELGVSAKFREREKMIENYIKSI